MLDATAAETADRSPAAISDIAAPGRRRRDLGACAALVLLLHGAFLSGAAGWSPGEAADPGPVAPSFSVRTIAAEAEALAEAAGPMAEPAPVPSPAPAPKPRVLRRVSEPASPSIAAEASDAKAGTRFRDLAAASAAASAAPEAAAASGAATLSRITEPGPAAPTHIAEAATDPAAIGAAAATAHPAASASAAPPPLLAPGESPPPTYRTRLPPPATLRYEVRRGFLRGTGEIRWLPTAEHYRLVLEARIAGLTLLIQTSEGGIDATGLAPVRFLDQRARRPAQAANLRRDLGKVTFSGPAVEWPLLPGTQDRLSWMIQLAGIAAAEPELLVEGGRIAMVVVGARGEAEVWALRYAGRETVEAVRGTIHAVKFVRDARSAYDTGAEIWLDPERDYFPAHATLRNSSGASEYDLLLERIEAPP